MSARTSEWPCLWGTAIVANMFNGRDLVLTRAGSRYWVAQSNGDAPFEFTTLNWKEAAHIFARRWRGA